jgi:DNA repair protein RecO
MKAETGNYYYTEGIVLKRQPYRESSLLCRVLTKDFGLVSIMATGALKEKSGFTGLLEQFNTLQLDLYRTPRGEIFNLRSAQLLNRSRERMNYQKTLLVNAAIELLLQSDFALGEGEEFYLLLSEYLNYLEKTEYHPFLIFLRYINRFLILIGIPFNAVCIKCNRKEFSYFFPQEDGFLCSSCYRPVLSENLLRLQDDTVDLLLNIFNLPVIEEQQINRESVEEIKNILLIHLTNHFNKPFHLNSLKDYMN